MVENSTSQEQRSDAYLCKTMEFTEDDYEHIIVRDTLFNNGTETSDDLQKKRQHLYNREVRINLHAITLSEYLHKKQIPRGLRIGKLLPTLLPTHNYYPHGAKFKTNVHWT